MKFSNGILAILVALALPMQSVNCFSNPSTVSFVGHAVANRFTKTSTSLKVSIGLGPDEEAATATPEDEEVKEEEIPEPDHELFRTSRLSDLDKKCDEWYASLLGSEDSPTFLGEVSDYAGKRIRSLVELKKQPILSNGDENWTPYQQNILPGSPILPAYGLEQYGLPIPRRNAEAWRHFDVPSLVARDYSANPASIGCDLDLDEAKTDEYKNTLKAKGAWIDDEACNGRLVYVNGRFVPSLSKVTDHVRNLCSEDFKTSSNGITDEVLENMKRLTDGFTDRLAADVPSGETDYLTSYKRLSEPDHNVGEATSQFAINGHQGTACFVALNSVKAGAVAFVNIPSGTDENSEDIKPVLVVNAQTADGGIDKDVEEDKGVSSHPRSLVMAGENSRLSFVQTYVDLDEDNAENSKPKFTNGFTQIFVKGGAKVNHSYIEETGGIPTGGVEAVDQEEGDLSPREIESKRKALRDTHFEAIDVHVTGDDGSYDSAVMSFGGNGRSRIAVSTSLLRPGAHVGINGFSLAGGAQRTDFRTLIHHIAQGTTSSQSQKNMIGGRATASFRGKIRVEQSAQQTDSQQLARTVLLSDKSKVWAIPSLEIIADDVQCTHGATVSDLSEEELFYLRSRGLDRTTARNILMYAFVDEVASSVDSTFQGSEDDPSNLKSRVISRLQNLVPQGDRAIRGEFQSV